MTAKNVMQKNNNSLAIVGGFVQNWQILEDSGKKNLYC